MSRVISQQRSRKLNVKTQNNAKKFIVKSQVKTNKSQDMHVHIWTTTPISRLTCPSQVKTSGKSRVMFKSNKGQG